MTEYERQDLTGRRFGMLLVNSLHHVGGNRVSNWNCTCDCGKTTIVSTLSFNIKNRRDCGCEDHNHAAFKSNASLYKLNFKPKDITEPEEIDRHTMEEEVYPSGFAGHW